MQPSGKKKMHGTIKDNIQICDTSEHWEEEKRNSMGRTAWQQKVSTKD